MILLPARDVLCGEALESLVLRSAGCCSLLRIDLGLPLFMLPALLRQESYARLPFP
jgi:hypothetical protein